MRKSNFFSLLCLAAFFPTLAAAEESRLAVKHDHALGSCRGELVFGQTALTYVTAHEKHARTWNYPDIQQLALMGPKKIAVLTYEDDRLRLGKDKIFHFQLTQGELSASLWEQLQKKLTKPLVSAVIPSGVEVKYRLAVKHRHAIGGCQGVLELSEGTVAYRTSHPGDSRVWPYGDLSSVGSTGPFQLRLSAMERTGGQYGGERNFIFDLKERLVPEVYDFIWWKVNGPQISGLRPSAPDAAKQAAKEL